MKEQKFKKIEVEVLENFFDDYYGKGRTIGDVFVCRSDLAFKRKSFSINGISKPLVKILRVVPDDYPEEPKAEVSQIQEIYNKIFNTK